MFQQLDLTNFRQHEALSVAFEKGVVALRGANEKGKSTIIEAIAYALFGARALREPLDEVVTWGRKVVTLKVKLGFCLNGVEYLVLRSKSGAELRSGDRIIATGQDEVTGYIETLLGASREVCAKLMLANQDDIKGALAKGPAAAVELIETLSNLNVVDVIIGLVQDKLPSGQTTSVESRIQMLEQQAELPVEDTTAPLVQAVAAAEYDEGTAKIEYDAQKLTYDATLQGAFAAQSAVEAHAAAVKEEAATKGRLQQAEVALASLTVPALPTNIPELRRLVEDSRFMERAARAATLLQTVKTAENEWEGDLDSLLAEIRTTASRQDATNATISNMRRDIAVLQAQKITQTACGLCGKDLSAVPEVVTKNAELDRAIAAKEQVLEEALSAGQAEQVMFNALNAIRNAHTSFMNTYQQCSEFVTLTLTPEGKQTHIPPKWEWSGPEEIKTNVNAARELQAAEAAERAHHAAVGRKEQLQADVVRLRTAWDDAATAVVAAASTLPGHHKALELSAQALSRLNDADATLRSCREAVQRARHALDVAQAGVREREAARALLVKQLEGARKELVEIDDNNALIRFLREARMTITDQFWSMVMSTVSSYFSDIRGTPSVVTRADSGFKVDGHSVAGLSGSAKDALGLALRKALTKTFLPNVPFLILDEPAAACDEGRETNMLGLIANSGFEQVILITHSDLADSFANQVVQL